MADIDKRTAGTAVSEESMNLERRHEILRRYMSKHGLKFSRQRDVIANVFFRTGGHLTVEELLRNVREVEPRVSQATVYRTMKLLTDCGLAEERNFIDGFTRYELADGDDEHHDHLICTECHRIVEFLNEEIEALQEQIAADHGFEVTHHKMELYGLCPSCRTASAQ